MYIFMLNWHDYLLFTDGYTLAEAVMYWEDIPIIGVEQVKLPQYTIAGYETSHRTEELSSGAYRRLTITFQLTRNIGYFIFQAFLPCMLIVMLSWISFWINMEASPARVGLGRYCTADNAKIYFLGITFLIYRLDRDRKKNLGKCAHCSLVEIYLENMTDSELYAFRKFCPRS